MWLWVGGLIGFILVQLDRVVYVYYLFPHEQLSQQVQYLVSKGQVLGAMKLVHQRRGEQQKLVFRSLVLMLAWVPIAIFAVTSTGSLFAGGVVMGLGLHLMYDLWRDQRKDPVGLNTKLFWQVKRAVGLEEQRWFLYGLTGMFILLTWMIV